MWNPASVIVAVVAVALSGCGAKQGTRPEDMSARAHRDEAGQHYARAQDAPNRSGYYGPYRGYIRYPYSFHWYPYLYRWDVDARAHTFEGDQHLEAAKALERDHAEACALVPRAEETISPIEAFLVGFDRTDDGVVLHLAAEAGPPEDLLHHLRCHRAWMALQGLDQMRDCPLGLKGLVVTVHASPQGMEVMITPADASQLPELERRARAVLQLTRPGSK